MIKYPSNEYELITKMQHLLPQIKNSPYDLTIGDDAAVRKNTDGEKLIFTADVSVENVHFSLDTMTLEEVGYKSMVTNLSDCAAMGASPESAIVQLVFPKNCCELDNAVLSIYNGFARACKNFNFQIVGGDLSCGDSWIIAITLTGVIAQNGRALTRKGIRDGDVLRVTGTPGASAAGLACLQHFGRDKIPEKYKNFANAHISPTPRINEGKLFASTNEVRATMDLSDGLSKDAATLCFDNDIGFIFDNNITPPADMLSLASDLNRDWRDWYFHGGEEYELLFVCAPEYNPTNSIKLGTFTKSVSGVYVADADVENQIIPLTSKSWDHFSK